MRFYRRAARRLARCELVPRFKRLFADQARPLYQRGDKETSLDVYCWPLGTKSNRQTCRSNSGWLARATTSPSKRSAEAEARSKWEVTRCYDPCTFFFRWRIKRKTAFLTKIVSFSLHLTLIRKLRNHFFLRSTQLRFIVLWIHENKRFFPLRLVGKLEILSIQSYEHHII